MPGFDPPDMKGLLSRVIGTSPRDIRLVAERLHDHALEPRLPPAEARALVRSLGFADLDDFCARIGLPARIAERWSRFGISGEMGQVLRFMAAERARMAEATEEFESMTHAGLDDFLKDRGLL